MRLLYAPASPYSAKVRMMAHALKLDVVAEKVDTAAETGILISSNPLGKIPVLLLADGQAIYDSRVIMQAFDRMSGGLVFSRRCCCTDKNACPRSNGGRDQ